MSFFFTFDAPFEGDLNITKPALWLDADPTTMTLTGADVGVWRDKSGNGRNFTQGTSGLRPDYEATGTSTGRPCVSFDGVDDVLPMDSGGLNMFNGVSAMTVLVVGQMATVTTGAGCFFYASDGAGTGTGRFNFYRQSGGANNRTALQVRRLDFPTGSSNTVATTATTPNQIGVMLGQYDPVAQTVQVYRDDPNTPVLTATGVNTSGNVSASNSAAIRLGTDGSGNFKALKIRTVGAWTRILTSTERLAIMRYYTAINR